MKYHKSGRRRIKDIHLVLSDIKLNKSAKQDRLQTQIDIENKILEANNLAPSAKDGKREGSGNPKGLVKNRSPSAKGVKGGVRPELVTMHQNPHIQMKDPRLREGEDKRTISSDRHGNYMATAHSPSAREPTTAEKYTLFGYSEDSIL